MTDFTPRFRMQQGGGGLTANSIGRQALPMMQPNIASPYPPSEDVPWRAKFATPEGIAAGRPFQDVGKLTVNLGNVGGSGQDNVKNTQGFLTGIGGGLGRFVGGFAGEQGANVGGKIGEVVGTVAQAPFDIAGNLLGAIPAIPFPGAMSGMTEAQRAEAQSKWDGNPLTYMHLMSDAEKAAWRQHVEAGEINPLFEDMAPAQSLGDQVSQAMGALGLASNLVQRTWAGGPGNAVGRIMATDDADLNPAVVDLKQQLRDGTITQDQFLDKVVMQNAGYTNEFGTNMLLSMVADPLLLLGGVTGIAAKASIGARMEKAANFVKLITKEEWTNLAANVEKRAAAEGVTLKEIPQEMIMDEAKKMGLHKNALNEAERQMSARKQFLAQNEMLDPIYKVAKNIADPVSGIVGSIGTRGSQPLKDAWLHAQATMGTAAAYGRHNFTHVQNALARLGAKDAFDEAMGYFTAQEGLFMQGDYLAQDVAASRKLSMARPTDIARARAGVGSQHYARRIESWIGNRKIDVTQPTGMGAATREEALIRAQDTATTKVQKIAGITEEEARKIVNGLDDDGLSMIDAAYFGHKIKLFNQATRTAREALSSVLAGPGKKGKVRAAQRMEALDRTTLIGPRELATGRAKKLAADLADTSIPTAERAMIGRQAIRSYDRLASNFIADGPTDEEIITDLQKWLDDFGDNLTDELTDAQKANLPKEMVDALDPEDGYIYGMRPEDGRAEWRAALNEDGTEITGANPWIDIVGDKAAPWAQKFQGDGRVTGMLQALDRAVGAMSHEITTDRIFREAKRDFIRKGIEGYAPGQKAAMTYREGEDLWDALLSHAKVLGTTPRGMKLSEFNDVIEKVPAAMEAGITGRDLMGMTLHSFEGRLSTVGVTQRFTGKLKTAGTRIPTMPDNLIGSMAERMYPLVRFSLNPYFQLQEWVEPWIFSAARGRTARLSQGWVDPLTGEHVAPLELMRMQQHLIDRYKASNPYAQFDMMERSLTYLHGSKAAKEASARVKNLRALEEARGMAGKIKSTGDRKVAAQSNMFRYFLGPILKEQMNSINPKAWAELEMLYGTRDMGTVAVRWLTESDAWSAIDPKVAAHLTGLQKPMSIGRLDPIQLDEVAQHTFKTTRPALTLRVKDGTLDIGDFRSMLEQEGAHSEYIDRAWKALQFDAKTGGVDEFWADISRGTHGLPKKQVAMMRALTRAQADAQGISEVEYLSRSLSGNVNSIMHDDLITKLEGDYANWEWLAQQKEYMDSNWFTSDPVTGALIHQTLDEQALRARFLESARNPPTDMPVAQHGAYDDMQEVTFGKGGRSLFIPGGKAALADIEKPWTVWEAHLIRNQLVDPNRLLDPKMKHALYMKLWRGHTLDMADPAGTYKLFNNLVMARTSAGLNLTRNELVSTRLRVNSPEHLQALADETSSIRETIKQSMPEGYEPTSGDIGLVYTTNRDVAHYIPLDSVESYARTSYRPEAGAAIKSRARMAGGYLESADHALHDRLPPLGKNKDVSRISEWAVDQAAEAIHKGGVAALRTLPPEFKATLKVILDPAAEGRIRTAAAKVIEDPMDLESRAILRELVPGAEKIDQSLVWKPYNVNGAGLPRAIAPDGRVIGHGDKGLFAYIKNDDVKWRGFSTNTAIGDTLQMAEDVVKNPHHYVRRAGEPLDQFAERISHRTKGLSLKTGYFGVDLGDPINFERGVMDTHMVGGLTDWLYHDVTNGGTDPRWQTFIDSLSADKKTLIAKWIDNGAPRKAGTFDWSEAEGKNLSFKPVEKDARVLDGATDTQKAAYVRRQIDKTKVIDQKAKDRLFAMYRNDEELAQLFGRDIKTFAGDYEVYENLMTERKALEATTDKTLNQHGNGGYQWKLWDDRRGMWDPETATFAAAHDMPRHSTRFLAGSDDIHRAAGFLDQENPTAGIGRYMDPFYTVMAQHEGQLFRGATVFANRAEQIVYITEHANASTLAHELTHALLEPSLDESGKGVVLEDINRIIRDDNARLITQGDEAKVVVDDLDAQVRQTFDALRLAEGQTQNVAKEAATKTKAAVRHEANAGNLVTEAAKAEGALKQVQRDAAARRKAINAQKLAPSIRARRLATVDNEINRAQKKFDTLVAERDAAAADVAPLWDEAHTAQAAAKSAREDESIIRSNWNDRRKEYQAARTEYETLAQTLPKEEKAVWDNDVSEHFANQFTTWLRTGKAPNAKLRDAFAYFHRVLQRLESFVRGNPQIKVSAAMEDLFKELHTPKVADRVAFANPVPFDATQEMYHAAGRESVISAEDAAFTNVQFRRGRSWLERSANHPYFGIYPASYMWGKVAPEMIRALALNPFGFPIPGMLEGSTPGLGFLNAQRAWASVEQQKDTDPEFRAFVTDPANDKMFRAAAMFMPATPWDDPANFPLWSRRFAEWGLESNQRVEEGKKPGKFDFLSTAHDVGTYAFGPTATLDWMSDILKMGNAPIVQQFTAGEDASGLGNLGPKDLVITPEGAKPLDQTLKDAQTQLQNTLGQ